VLNEAGQIQLERGVRTNAKALREVFGTMPRSRIALETGTHSPWISRLLSELGHKVIVAHARKVRLIGESQKRMTAWTPRLWHGQYRPRVAVPSEASQRAGASGPDGDSSAADLVRARTPLVNTARSFAKSYGGRLRDCNVRYMNPEKAERLSPELQSAVEPLLGDRVLE
jgi:transposase